MSRLYLQKMDVECVNLGPESSLPMLYEVDDKGFYKRTELSRKR